MIDLIIEGSSSFDTALPLFVTTIIRYAFYLHRETSAIVLGYFTADSNIEDEPILELSSI
jgi:hypothetical protein